MSDWLNLFKVDFLVPDCMVPCLTMVLPEAEPMRGLALGYQLSGVNELVNSKPYVSEVTDHLVPPDEFLRSGGDCEDYAVAKLTLLLNLGWKLDDMRVVHLYREGWTGGHCVLVVRAFGTYQVLNNDQGEPHMAANYFLPNDTAIWQYTG